MQYLVKVVSMTYALASETTYASHAAYRRAGARFLKSRVSTVDHVTFSFPVQLVQPLARSHSRLVPD